MINGICFPMTSVPTFFQESAKFHPHFQYPHWGFLKKAGSQVAAAAALLQREGSKSLRANEGSRLFGSE